MLYFNRKRYLLSKIIVLIIDIMARPKGLVQSASSRNKISQAQKIRYQMMKEELARKHGQFFNEADDSKLSEYEKLQTKLRKSIAAFTSALMDLANFNTRQSQHSGESTTQSTRPTWVDNEKLDNVVRSSIKKIMNKKREGGN